MIPSSTLWHDLVKIVLDQDDLGLQICLDRRCGARDREITDYAVMLAEVIVPVTATIGLRRQRTASSNQSRWSVWVERSYVWQARTRHSIQRHEVWVCSMVQDGMVDVVVAEYLERLDK
jgi:hypothetical protein